MVTYNQKTFLEQFDQPIRKYIIEYCKKISEKKYDVYILLARKAACFLTTLEELGFIRLNGIVVSDRILDYNTEWLAGKNVAIIDDTIISGTSIRKIIERLKQINVSSISVHAFCINDYWYVNDILQDENCIYLTPPYMRVDHASSIRFCRQIVEALSIIPRPYNIDFPVYEIGKISRRHYSTIIEDKNWKVVDTATLLQKEYNVECASLNFKRELLREFNDSLGIDLSQVLFVKLRLFTKELFDNTNIEQSRYSCKVVPYVIFNPVKFDLLQRFIEVICNCENISVDSIENELTTENSKLLFVQYYFAARLTIWWINYTEKLLCKDISHDVNKRSLYLLFPPSIIKIVNNFTFNGKINISTDIVQSNVFCHGSTLSHPNQLVNPLEIKAKLTNIFLNLYYEKELPARHLMKEMGKKAFFEKNNYSIINRLYDGISLDRLKDEIATNINNTTDRNLILSTFLDNAIDRGIIVPITSINNGYIYRGFRHGEEVIWGDANDKLLAKFFGAFLGKNNKIISKFWFEKLLVIFLKIGLRLKFLNEYDQSTPENQKICLIGVRSYLYGQISIIYEIKPYEEVNYNPILDSETRSYWTTKRLLDMGLITAKDERQGYELCFNRLFNRYKTIDGALKDTDIDLDQEHVDKVLNLAEVLKLCKDSRLIDSSGLVMLTSCVSLHDNIASIGAELQIYAKNLNSYANQIDGAVKFKNCTIEFLASLRNPQKNILWTAINSGKDKYLKFKTGKGMELVSEIGEKLETINTFASRHWNDYWRKDIDLLKTQDNELNGLNTRMGSMLIDIQIIIICIHLVLFEIIKREQGWEDYLQIQKSRLNKINEEIKNIRQTYSTTNNETSPDFADRLNTEKKRITKNLKQWDNYIASNVATINSNLKYINTKEYIQSINNEFVSNILGESYQRMTDSELYNFVHNLIKQLNQLKDDANEALVDFSALVPQWGKIRKTVLYRSLLHFNINSDEKRQREKIGQIIKAELGSFELDEYEGQMNDKSIVILKVDEIKAGGRGYIIGAKGQRHDERLLKLGCRILRRCKELNERIVITLCPFSSTDGHRAYFNAQTKLYDIVKEDLYKILPINNEEGCINIFVRDTRQNDNYVSSILKKYSLNREFDEKVVSHTNNTIQFLLTLRPKRKKIFISYSRKDVDYKDELKKHLLMLNQTNIVDTWSCEDIVIGQWDPQIKRQLQESDLIIYMLSANFFSSPYILEHEVQNIIQNGTKKDILCVIVSDFTDLNNINDYISQHSIDVSDRQKAIIALKEFQYMPYGKVLNHVTNQREEKIVSLKNYTNETGLAIESAFSQIANKIMTLFQSE